VKPVLSIQATATAGSCRVLPELEERAGQTVNHRWLRRLLREHELGLHRYLSEAGPSPVREILRETSRQLNLFEEYLDTDRELEPLDVFSTDFTELGYAEGARKAHLADVTSAMAVVDVGSRCALGWAVGRRANRSSRCDAGSTCALRWPHSVSRWKDAYCTPTSTAFTRAPIGCDRFCSTTDCG